MRRVAVFDIDGTVFRSSLTIELVEELIARGLFPESARKIYEKERRRWNDRRGSYEEYIRAVVRAFEKNLKGVRYADFADAASRVVVRERDRVYRYTRDLISDLRRRGYFLLAVSQSPKTILDGFARRLGFHKVYGRIYEIGAESRLTGALVDEHLIENKAAIVRRAAEKENLTLRGSIGVGDTESDIPFLEIVARPVCFNPNATLYRHARRLGWKVVVERKDVIYEL